MAINDLERSITAFGAVRSYLDGVADYEADESKKTIKFYVDGGKSVLPAELKIIIFLQVMRLSVKFDFLVPDKKRSDVALALTGLNNIISDGGFVLDYSEGVLEYRVSDCYLNRMTDKATFDYMVGVARSTVDHYYKRLEDLSSGDISLPEFLFMLHE